MSQASVEYVHKTPQGGWRVADSRISLDSILHAHFEGKSPEAIAQEFPSLSEEQIYGAIAFYLHHRAEIDEYLARQEAEWQKFSAVSESQHGTLLNRLRE